MISLCTSNSIFGLLCLLLVILQFRAGGRAGPSKRMLQTSFRSCISLQKLRPSIFQAFLSDKIVSGEEKEVDKVEDEVITSLGQKSHIPAPKVEKPEFSPLTALGTPEFKTKETEEVITFLGTKPEAEKKPEEPEVITWLGEKPKQEEMAAIETERKKERGEEEEITILPGLKEKFEISEIPISLMPRFIIKNKPDKLKSIDAFTVSQALSKMIGEAKAGFDETAEVHFNLNIDPRKSDQLVRGLAVLPHGTGKTLKIAVFAEDEDITRAKEAGAEIAGGMELIREVEETKGGKLNQIDKCIATPAMMKHLVKLGKILGPKGLMPNPKMGTITENISETLAELKRGKIEFRVDRTGILHVPFGKVKFGETRLLDNFAALGTSVLQCRPKNVKGKGHTGFIKKITFASTMGRGLPVTVSEFVSLVKSRKKEFANI